MNDAADAPVCVCHTLWVSFHQFLLLMVVQQWYNSGSLFTVKTQGVCNLHQLPQAPRETCLRHLQNFTGTGYSGLVYDAPEQLRDYSVKGKWRIPVNMHIGNMGLAPAVGAPLITAPPMRTGGNIDNKRIGIGGARCCKTKITMLSESCRQNCWEVKHVHSNVGQIATKQAPCLYLPGILIKKLVCISDPYPVVLSCWVLNTGRWRQQHWL